MIEFRRDDERRLNVVIIRERLGRSEMAHLTALMADPEFTQAHDRLVLLEEGADRALDVRAADLVTLAVAVTREISRANPGRPVKAALVLGAAGEDPMVSGWPMFQRGPDPVIEQTLCADRAEALDHLGLPCDYDPWAPPLIRRAA